MASVIRIKRTRNEESVDSIVLRSGTDTSFHSSDHSPNTHDGPLKFRRICTVPAEQTKDTGEAIPEFVKGVIKQVWNVRNTRKRIRDKKEQGMDEAEGEEDVHDEVSGLAEYISTSNILGDRSKASDDFDGPFQKKKFKPASSSKSYLDPSVMSMRVFDLNSAPDPLTDQSDNSGGFISIRRVFRPRINISTLPPTSCYSDNPGRPKNVPILTPFQVKMDEAIWTCFRMKNADKIFECIAAGADVNFVRKVADGSSALMALAFIGDAKGVAELVRYGALAHLKDYEGKDASFFAKISGFKALSKALSDLSISEIREIESLKKIYTLNRNGSPPSVEISPSEEKSNLDAEMYDIYVPDDPDTFDDSYNSRENVISKPECTEKGDSMLDERSKTFLLNEDDFDFVNQHGHEICDWDMMEVFQNDEAADNESHDSEDSNREDAEGNDYPEDAYFDDSEEEEEGW